MALRRSDRLLIAIVKTPGDLRIFEEEGWYRIPVGVGVTKDEDNWPPGWVAAFEGVQASGGTQQVLRYAEVRDIEIRSREELMPELPSGSKRGRMYYRLALGPIQRLPIPLIPQRARRAPFIQTSIAKLVTAASFNDVFTGGRFEDELWQAFQGSLIDAERQWNVSVDRREYVLDFAVFCKERTIDVEIDGRQHHSVEARSEYDADRDKDLTRKGWAVQRFLAARVGKSINGCLAEVSEAIERYGGLKTARFRLIPRPEGAARQMALLEERAAYGTAETTEL
jgi:very-short-patch-repair endonuclease